MSVRTGFTCAFFMPSVPSGKRVTALGGHRPALGKWMIPDERGPLAATNCIAAIWKGACKHEPPAQSSGTTQPHTDIVVPVVWIVVVAIRGPRIVRFIIPRATTQHPRRASQGTPQSISTASTVYPKTDQIDSPDPVCLRPARKITQEQKTGLALRACFAPP